MNRRKVLQTFSLTPLVLTSKFNSKIYTPVKNCYNLKLSLNAYSFNEDLSNGNMTVEDMIDFCAEHGFAGVDLTAYYFPGYPEVPPDEYLYHIKQYAFRKGIGISGTGVRNDFTTDDYTQIREHVNLVKKWIVAAEKIGAPVIRIFAGNAVVEGNQRERKMAILIELLRECANFGKEHGVVVAIQNHNDFIQTADQAIRIIEMVNQPEWFGLILDTGSYRLEEAYQAIRRSIPFTVNWQIKELIFENGKEVATDIPRLIKMIKDECYQGYIPIETLGEGDAKKKVIALLNKIQKAL